MITLSAALPALSSSLLSLYYTRDVLLGDLPVLVFYGPSTTGNSTHNSSRIQAHVYSLAGFQSFPRLTIAPTSPLYAAVNHLPVEQRGDEVSRGLAVSLLSYFAGLPKAMKTTLRDRAAAHRPNRVAPMMFDEMHAGDLAASMLEVEHKTDVANFVLSALTTRVLSWVDMDVILPPGIIQRATCAEGQDSMPLLDENGLPLFQYGEYTSIVGSLGSPAFLPTSKLQRTPSRPTAHSKSKTLSKDQKISLRRELCELVDTESSYIGKISDLANSVAPGFRQNAGSDIVEALFPQSLAHILEANEKFYNEIQSTLDETENEAIRDIEGDSGTENDLGSPVTQSRRRDPTGTTHIAKALLRWFPKFMGPYQDYMRTSTNFPAIISQILGDASSGLSLHLQGFGEQRLRSALIEPVQRLPRYSLLIDNIVNLLPASHPALSSLLKARDTITEICALDTSTPRDSTRSAKILRNLVAEWPVSLSPGGRLITAVDIVDLDPPYIAKGEGSAGVLLLLANTVVVLRKFGETPLSARGIVAEVDRPITPTSTFLSPTSGNDKGLIFLEAFDLFDLRFSESEDGRLIWMTISGQTAPILSSASTVARSSTKVFSLLGPYEGKAARLSEEIVKARIEGRFPEGVRDGGNWALRCINPSDGSLGIQVTLSEDRLERNAGLVHAFCQVQLSVDGRDDSKAILAKGRGTNIAACITASGAGNYRLESEGSDGTLFTDSCTSDNVVVVLLARLNNLVRLQHQPQNASLIQSQISYNQTNLEATPIEMQQEEARPRNFRPLSPVKLISNYLAGASSGQTSTPTKHRHKTAILKDIPSIPPPTPSKSKVDLSSASEPNPFSSKVTLVDSSTEAYKSPLALSEDTFLAYVIALRSRSGNVVGKVLRNRTTADELAINELYNTLLEDPSRLQVAAEVSVDVLFAAFEKFLKRAWRERMGPLLTVNALQNMQSAFDLGKPVLFSQQVKKSLEDMSPQSKRAFAATVRLLADLLDASGNDGDRGALMASFAEALVLDGNPHDYIMLLDRLVDDFDNLFDETSTALSEDSTRSAAGSLTRTRSFNTSSMSSNTSSLRKRFGFGTLTRENSKNESESKVASIWRTLSKNARSPGDSYSQPPSFSKATGVPLGRSRSTDTDTRMLPPLRPVSRDRPTTSGSAPQEEPRSRPGSSHLNTSMLSSIGENTPTKPAVLSKKKRRSSLSDLKLLNESDAAAEWSPLQPRKLTNAQDASGTVQKLPRTPSPVKQSPSQWANKQPSQRSGLPQRFGSPHRKENSPIQDTRPSKQNSPAMPCTPSAKAAVNGRSEEVVITSYSSPPKQQTSHSGIPAPKGGLSERTWPPNSSNTPPKKAASSPQKLRMQSPQKIRERLSQEQKTLTISDESFQAEMTNISEEMATYKIQRSLTKPRSTVPASRSTSHSRLPSPTLESLSSQLITLSTNISNFTETQKVSLAAISSDVESSLLVSDRKARKLNELYREANAENEALYERFNDELGKILGKVRKGEGVDEMRNKLKEAQEDVVRLKKENGRLKREAVGLRSLMKGE